MIQNSVPELFSLQAQKKLRSGSEFRCITDGQNKVLTHILSHKMWSTELIWRLKDSLERSNVESLQGTRCRTASYNLDTQVTFSLKNSCKNKKHNASPSIFFPVHSISPLSPWFAMWTPDQSNMSVQAEINRRRASVFGCLVSTLPFYGGFCV